MGKQPTITEVLNQVMGELQAVREENRVIKEYVRSMSLNMESRGARPTPPTPPTPEEQVMRILNILEKHELKAYAVKLCGLDKSTIGVFGSKQLIALLKPKFLELHAKNKLPECNAGKKSPKDSTEQVANNSKYNTQGVCSQCGKELRGKATMCARCENRMGIEALKAKQAKQGKTELLDDIEVELSPRQAQWAGLWRKYQDHEIIATEMGISVTTSYSYPQKIKKQYGIDLIN